jgi:iron complex transport system substrate-binding protein
MLRSPVKLTGWAIRKYSPIVLCLLWLAAGCRPSASDTGAQTQVHTDALGRSVTIPTALQRILPFTPALTEILYLIGDTSQIIARTPQCNYPPAAMQKPVVNNYPPDLENILALRPEVLFTSEGMLSLPYTQQIEKMGIPVFFQKYDRVQDIFTNIEQLGMLTGHSQRALWVADSLRKALLQAQATLPVANPPRVLMLISKDKIFAFGKNTYASDIIELAGGINVLDSIHEQPFPMLSTEYILKLNPDVLIGGPHVALDGIFFKQHSQLQHINAYKNNRYYTVNDDHLSRPGPRVVEAVRDIRKLLDATRTDHDNNQKHY